MFFYKNGSPRRLRSRTPPEAAEHLQEIISRLEDTAKSAQRLRIAPEATLS